jgi:DNA uptake protein ComE-like DNA-binding protein
VIVLLIVVSLYGAGRYWRNRSYVSNPQPEPPAMASELADRIDPNTADVATLSALPLIGERKARDIIAWRDAQKTQPAFRGPDDLLKIKGIGVSTVKQLEPYLIFPKEKE